MGCLSLDHDLGAQETGMQFLHWLIERHLDHELDLQQVQQVIVHSANPVGAANLRALWDGFAKHIGSAVRAELRPSLM
jgi:hypothetical protein